MFVDDVVEGVGYIAGDSAVGEHEVEVKINNTNPLVSYVVSSKIKIKITQK